MHNHSKSDLKQHVLTLLIQWVFFTQLKTGDLEPPHLPVQASPGMTWIARVTETSFHIVACPPGRQLWLVHMMVKGYHQQRGQIPMDNS